jgi:hypothetical protein
MNLYPWQQQIFDKITSGGFKPGEMLVMSAGRGIGKSALTAQTVERLMRDLNSQPVSDLTLSEGRVYGARYYCVEPIGGNWPEMEQWAIKTYGEVGSVWRADKWVEEPAQRWYANNRKFWFRNEADRTMFILKWR